MNTTVETLKTQLLALPIHDRAELASFLLSSLDEGEDEDSAVVQGAWNAELKGRIEEIENGQLIGMPAKDVFAEFRKKHA